MAERVLVVGLGQMGGAFAVRLAGAGFDVVGYDVDADARKARAAEGLSVVDTLDAAVADRTLVLTSLPNSTVVRSVWLGASGSDGLVARAAPGSVLVEMSTIDPDTMREVGAAAAGRGLGVVDCPVSGGPMEAASGKLSLIAGGADEHVERARPVLLGLGTTLHRTGEVGTGKVVKLVNNMMSMGNIVVAAEAFAVGEAAGVDPRTLYDVLSVSGGTSNHFTKRFPWAIEGDFAARFKMSLGEKDIALGIDLARSVGTPAPAAAAIHQMYAMALAEGLADQDVVATLRLYHQWSAGHPSTEDQS